MLIISHRGNIISPNPDEENIPSYINQAIELGFDVEVDCWRIGNELFLGHDKPVYKVNFNFLDQLPIWVHCKNIELAEFLSRTKTIKYFWHQNDDIALTSNGFIWTYPGKKLTKKSIAVLPETVPDWDIKNTYGICTDYPLKYKNGTL
jgi:hypothetical protein